MTNRIFTLLSKAALMAICLISTPAFALQILPDTGRWGNINEPGRNFSIEIQDNQLTLHTQLYEDGWPVWFYSQGTMIGSDYYEGSLIRWVDGQCMTCPWIPPTRVGSVGDIQILFTSPRTAIMNWPGGTLELAHADTALWLGTVYAPLGEWAIVGGTEYTAMYFGERITFDWVGNDGVEDYLAGYRSGDYYSPAYLWYYPDYDSYWGELYASDGWNYAYSFQFYGQATIRGWVQFYQAGTEPTGEWYPFVGFRMKSAARAETGYGPGMEEGYYLDGYE